MSADRRSRAFFLAVRLFAVLAVVTTFGSGEAFAASCGLTKSCPTDYYCPNPVNPLNNTTCKAQGDAGDSCDIVATCKSPLVCDALGECRHSPPQEGEPCGTFVACASGLTCSADVAGRCEAAGQAGDSCSGVGQGSCASGLVCDANRTCRHDPPQAGEPCGTGVSCASGYVCSDAAGGTCQAQGDAGDGCNLLVADSCKSGLVCDASSVCRHDPPERGEPCGVGVSCAGALVCSADVGGTCGDRGGSGDSCSGTGQGSCAAGLVCDARRVCRHDPPRLNEPCGVGVDCADGLFCQGGTQVCKKYKTIGEGCSAFNPCMEGLACDPCFTDGCDYPFQCFPNPNDGAIDQQTCRTLYSPGQHQAAKDAGVAMTWAAGDAAAAGVGESQEFGVVYGPDGEYGCFTTVCAGVIVDVSISAFVSVGFYDSFDVVEGSSTAVIEGVGVGVAAFSTSQIYPRNSADPFDVGDTPIGTEDVLAVTVSPDDIVIPLNAGTFACETVVDSVTPTTGFCGDGFVDEGEGCDDGNNASGDGCSDACVVEASCGNGALDTGEGCDDGNTAGGDGCSAQCQVEPRCGDGNLDLGEQCDDGNTVGGDGCSANCTIEAASGDAGDSGGGGGGGGCTASPEAGFDPALPFLLLGPVATLWLRRRLRWGEARSARDCDGGAITLRDARTSCTCAPGPCGTQWKVNGA